jgi:hypothetical protein
MGHHVRWPQAEVLWKILMPSLKRPNLVAHTRGTFEKHAILGELSSSANLSVDLLNYAARQLKLESFLPGVELQINQESI